MKSTILIGAAGLALLAPATALAAPATVTLRVEGPTRTLVERQVTVDVRTFKFTDDPMQIQCDGTGSTGTTTTPSPTRNGALAQAAETTPFTTSGTFFSFGPSFDQINGESVEFNQTTNAYLVEYKNGMAREVGGCGDPVVTGDDVLYAYGTGTEPLLKLAGPATVKPGETAQLTVTDQTAGTPVAGASVAGTTTSAGGTAATASLTARGPQSFKASKSGSIRSNAVSVCVTDGADGFCGTTKPGTAGPTTQAPLAPAAADKLAAFGKLGSIREGQKFARGKGPRTLAGSVDPDQLQDVRLRLSRTDRGKCTRYDGAAERFVKARCGVKNAKTFSVGASSPFSYLLPSALPRGRYVLDVIVIDRARNQTTTYQRGRNRVVFTVG